MGRKTGINNTTLYTYNDFSNIISAPGLTYTYDAEGNRTKMVYSGKTVDYIYDTVGRLSNVKLNGQQYASYTYDSVGNPLTKTTAAGTTSYTYDDANDLNICELGTIEDIDFDDYRNNKPTFAGYYGQVVQKYKEIQPRAKFFLVTLPKDNTYPKNKEHRDLLEEMTKKFDNTYLIDLNTYAPEYNEEFKENFFMHVHMNPAGYVFTADMIMSYIDYIIRNNVRDFDEIAFIGTNVTNL